MFARAARRPRLSPLFGFCIALFAIVLGLVVPATPAAAAPILKLGIVLVPGTTLPIQSGQPFRMRLTYECSSSLASDTCANLVVTSTLPSELEGLSVSGNSDVQLAGYNPATRTATWTFNSPLPLGTTGQLEFEARFLPGVTVDNTTATVTATVSANGAAPTNTTLPGITADATDQSTVTKTLESGGAVGDVSNYRIDVCPGLLGALDLTNVTITDTLPLGATYVSSSPPATSVNTSVSPNVVVWSGIPAVKVPNCKAFRVSALFPDTDPSNTVGASKTNGVSVSGTPYGGVVKTMTTSVNHTLENPDPRFALYKSADDDSIIGAEVTTNLRVVNEGNVQVSNVVASDPIPNEYAVSSIHAMNAAYTVAYQKNGNPTWITGVPTGTNVLVSSFPGFAAGDYVSGLRFSLGTIPVAFDSSATITDTIAIYSTVINPPHGSASSFTLPHYVTNTATLSGEFKGTPLVDESDNATTEISVPKARPTPQKAIIAGNPALPGKTVTYELRMFNGTFLGLDNPVMADLLPTALDYTPGSWTLVENIPSCITTPTFTTTTDFNGSGRTLLQWSWAGSGCTIPVGDDAVIRFDVKVKAGTYPTVMSNRLALVDYSTDPALVRKNKCATGAPEESIFTSGGIDATKLCFSPPSDLRVLAAASITSAKYVKGQLDSMFHRDPKVGATVQGGLITYQMEIGNTGNVDFKNLQLVDVLPFDLPAPGNQGVRDLAVLGSKWTPQLAGPVAVSPPIPGLTIRYSTETNPCRPNLAPSNPGCTPMTDGVTPGPGIWSTQLPSDPTTVHALKFDFGPYVLPANAVLRFAFPMFAPDDAPIAAPGSDGVFGNNDDTNVAWNTFAYEATRADDGATLVAQPPRVGIEVQGPTAGLASYGDYVWNDANQNGTQDEPTFRGINGVTVNLYSDADGNPATTGDQTLIGTKITANDASSRPGYYVFPALTPGNYFAEFVPPTGFSVSPKDAAGDTIDSDIDPVTFRSHITTLVANQNYRDTDAGFFAPVVSLGNRLWYDTNNDTIDNDGAGAALGSSTGIQGATVQLFLDANGDGKLTGAEQNWLAQQTTDANGFYTFTQQTHSGGVALGSPEPLYPARYIVGVPATNFAAGATLAGYRSSGTTISSSGVIAETAAPDPDLGPDGLPGTADDDRDRDDNGDTVRPTTLVPTPFYQGGVLSKAVFVDTNEPTGEPESPGSAPGPVAIPDANSNLTVDFGFYTTSLGNVVWDDNGAGGGTRSNGLRDGGEPGIPGVAVKLFSADDAIEIPVGTDGILGTADDAPGGVTTDASGVYHFFGLPQGTYRVHLTPPTGYVSTRDTTGTANPNSNVDNDDNGPGVGPGLVTSGSVTLTPAATGALNNTTVNAAAGSTSDPTVDFGLIRYYSLGNRVWHDTDNSGTLNGAEAGLAGVQVRLYLSDGTTTARHIDGSTVADATTDASGYYRFDNLPAGDYLVEVTNNNFIGGGPLVGFRTSTGAANAYEPAPDPDNDTDSDDNGTIGGGVARSAVVTLGEGAGTAEPTGDTDGGAIGGSEAPDNQSNRTVDFGFYAVYSLGNRVWNDADNNGRIDAGEVGLDGRTVKLYLDSNNDGTPDGAAIATTTTANGGYYLFTGLLANTYIVEVDTPAGFKTSTGDFGGYEPAPDPDSDIDNDDNGELGGGVVRSHPVTLSFGAEPTGEGATPGTTDDARDTNNNSTVDFGFFQPLSLGNFVWEDTDNSGTVNGGETGIPNVAVRLYKSDGAGLPRDLNGDTVITTADAIRTQLTNASGHYLFTDLGAGDYIVEVDTPAGYHTSTGQAMPQPFEPAPDPDTGLDGVVGGGDDDRDDDDNGTISGASVRSKPVTLSVGAEPTGEPATPGFSDPTGDTETNLTVDFGFYKALSLGNRVWEDADNNGTFNGAEAGLPAVTVRLYRDSLNDGTPDDLNGDTFITAADAIATTTTNASGHYLFTGLNADTYIVDIVPPAGFRSSTGAANAYEPAPDPDNDVDNDDNGSASGAVIRSKPVMLTVGGEPTGEPATPGIADATADNRANYTVDFGLYTPLRLGNLVWEDANNNGVFDAGEQPLQNATVTLLTSAGGPVSDADGNPVGSITTPASGLYLFTNLNPGSYKVQVTAPAGFLSSADVVSTANPNNDTDNDDNGPSNTNSVTSNAVTLTSHGEPNTPTDGDDTAGNLTLDFGFFFPLRLGNFVWEDANNNGTFDAGEQPIQGATVTLQTSAGGTVTDVNGATVTAQTTPASGLYLFANLAPGNYKVQVVAPAGFRSSTDIVSTANPNNNTNNDDNGPGTANSVTSSTITLTSHGEPNTPADGDDTAGNLTLDFGFFTPLHLGNFVWDDKNNNGVFDAGEQPLQNAIVTLLTGAGGTVTDVNGATVTAQTTPASGLYQFTNLLPGTYKVQVTAPVGFRSSADIASTANPDNDTDNDDNGVGAGNVATSAVVTLSSHGEPDVAVDTDDTTGNLTLDFGFFQPLRLGNLVWEDANNNGLFDAGEQPLQGATIRLFKSDGVTPAVDTNGATVTAQTTPASGLYLFTNLPEGDYKVQVTAPAGFISSTDIASTANPNNDTNNDDNGPGSGNVVMSAAVTLSSYGEPAVGVDGDDTNGNLTLDFGFFTPLRLGNFVWEDANNNGVFDAGEQPIQNATVTLLTSAGGPVTDASGATVGSVTTPSTGLYQFTNLLPGDYKVQVTAPAGFLSSTDIGSTASPNNDTNNDDNGPGTTNSVTSNAITLTSHGEPATGVDSDDTAGNLTLDFGFFHPLVLGNLVWEDANNNGLFDTGEQPITGATVTLLTSAGGTVTDASGSSVGGITTGATGLYQFVNLLPGDYKVRVTPPAGFRSSTDVASTANPNNDTDNDDNGIVTGGVVESNIVTLSSHGEPAAGVDGDDTNGNLTLDFGFFHTLTLGNFVWDDLNNNGVFDSGEPPLQGATVTLLTAAGGPVTDANGASVGSFTTTTTGAYQFTNLLPGQYKVQVTAPTGFRSSFDIATSANPDNDTNNDDNGVGTTNSVTSAVVTLSSGGEPAAGTDGDDTNGNLTVDFGFFTPLRLGNFVWEDANNNGVFDTGEQPLQGATVTLLKSDGTPAVDVDGATVTAQTTPASGLYLFTNLAQGDYKVQVAAPAGFRSSDDISSSAAPNNDTDSDDNGVGVGNVATSNAVTLSSHGEPPAGVDTDDTDGNLTVDFGFFHPLVLGNLVWEDANNNGIFDAGDTPLANATVTLLDATNEPASDADGNPVADQITGADGLYLFTNLAPGSYKVEVTAPTGFRSSDDIATSANADNDTDNDDNGVGVGNVATSSLVVLSSRGEPPVGTDGDDTSGNLTVDFGFFHSLALGNLVWEDADNSGTYNTGDTPLQGATVSLFKADGTTPATDADGTTIASQTTTSSGLYLFTNLAPGQYVVKVTAPTGFRSSDDIATSANADNDTNDDDNGVGVGNVATSSVVTLTSSGEPDTATDGDDTSGNLTVDFGFFTPLRLGNLVWDDVANNGVYDAGTDKPLAGATVSLFKSDGTTPAVDADGTPIASQTTAADGLYLFTNLAPGQYVVKVTPPAGFRSSTDIATSANPDNDTNNDDNGIGIANGAASGVITLSSHGEPASGVDSDDTSGNLTVDFGFYELLRLGNLVWNDADNNGTFTTGEQPLAGATVRLLKSDGTPAVDVDGVLVATQTTTSTGTYLFINLAPGSYKVEVTAPTGFRSSDDIATSATANNDTDNDDNGIGATNIVTSSAVVLSSHGEPPVGTDGDDTSSNLTVDFGFFHPLVLGNLVWEDADNSGTYNTGDTPLAGATVSLFKADGTTPAVDMSGATVPNQTTASDGLYLFTNLAPGQYVVKVTAPTGFRSSDDIATSANADNDTNNDDNGVGTGNSVASSVVTLTSNGEPDTATDGDDTSGNLTVDFGFYTPLRLGNLVWEDAAYDGLFDIGTDKPLAGATVSLFYADGTTPAKDAGGALVASQTTLADGLYLFTNLKPGQYVVKVTPPAGFRSTVDGEGTFFPNNDTDNDDNGNGTGPTATSSPITLSSRGEPDTAADGDDTSGNLTVDFGFFHLLRLGNLVWEDANNNGVFDATTDRALAGATVSLFEGDGTTPAVDVDGTLIASQTTAADGLYLFTNLVPGQYVVKVTAPTGFRSSTDVATTTNPDANRDNDDNGEGTTASVASRAVTLSSRGEPDTAADGDDTSGNLTVDFGFYQPLRLGNRVWDDRANNGVFDGADTPLAGATVSLFGSDGVTPAVDADGNLVPSQTTAADGLYLFTNLAPGQYVVQVVGPAGYESSSDIASSLTPDNDRDNDDNGEGNGATAKSRPITLASHSEPDTAADTDDTAGNLTVDFGFFRPATIGDRVWLDLDKNGVQDGSETGVSGVSVTLYRPGRDGLPGTPDDTAVFTTTTGVNGAYLFDRLGAGDYFVQFHLPPGFARSPLAGSADPLTDSDADPTTGRTVVTTLDPGENDLTWDAGIYFTASLGNRVWFDRDANGVQDAGELGIPNVVVTLRDGKGTQVTTTTTDLNGFYAFPTLPPGDYKVEFTPPAGYVFSPTGGSPIADANSDADPATGITPVTTIDPGESDPTWDAGLYMPVRLGNLVWEDTNNNGLVDAGEKGIANVTVRLFRDANGDNVPDSFTALATTTTDANGHYLFDNLVPGTYLVEILPPAGYATSTGRNGMATGGYEAAPDPDGDTDDDDNGTRVSATLVRSLSVVLVSSGEPDAATDTDDPNGNLTVDFGLFRPAAIGNVVWYDTDGNGRRDPGEAGVPGVTITLYYGNGQPVTDALGRPIQVVTGPDGSFIFDNLIPGTYQISVTNLPPGYTFTTPNTGSDDADSDVNPISGVSDTVAVAAGEQVLTVYAGVINPTAISLVRFGAARTAAGVELTWETGAEFNTAGFRIYRSATGNAADAVLLTDALLVARGGPQAGASYRWLDTHADAGVAYSYWLEEVEVGGGATRFGPAKVGATTAASTYSVFLPLVTR